MRAAPRRYDGRDFAADGYRQAADTRDLRPTRTGPSARACIRAVHDDNRNSESLFNSGRPAVTGLPHDLTDLYLAPVALSLDAVLEEWGALDQDDLAFKVSPYAGIRPEWTRDDRAEALLAAVAYSVDCHEWSLSWHPRGLMLTHKGHRFVLGVPANFREFLDGSASDTE